MLKADIGGARGKAVLTETTFAGWGEGKASAPMLDWKPQRLGPNPPEAMVAVADAAFSRMVAACGASVSLFSDADGTAQREALRRWHMGTVRPLANCWSTNSPPGWRPRCGSSSTATRSTSKPAPRRSKRLSPGAPT